jgi:DNA polymerase-1
MPGEYEADDLMAMTQGPNSVICSVDKDLLQVPGFHFNFVKNTFSYVEEIEGWRIFDTQVLTGDDSYGIVGLYGIGPAKAKKILAGLSTPFLMYTAVLKAYLEHTPKLPEEDQTSYHTRVISMVHMNIHLLYLCRHLGDRWKEPVWE